MNTPEAIRDFLGSYVRQQSNGQGKNLPMPMGDDHDLLSLGVMDSQDFLNMLLAVEAHFGRRIDFEELDPEQMTIVGPLCKFVSEQLSKAQ